MLIKDVCRECKLTKKAIEYYEQQGLISPKVENNGYRNYSKEDITVLKEVGVLRKLGISIAEVKDILDSSNKSAAIARCKYKLDLEIERAMARKNCLEGLIEDYDIERAITYIEENIEKHFTVKEKLLEAFPGEYGIYVCVHFGYFLNEKIDTEGKKGAYYKIVDYLDELREVKLPEELKELFNQSFGQLKEVNMEGMNLSIIDSVNNIDVYLEENREVIGKYLEYRNSDEYKSSPAYKIRQLLLKYLQENEYYDIFIENLKILSDSYREYFEKLQVANEVIINKYNTSFLS